jgi:hypothetical protein
MDRPCSIARQFLLWNKGKCSALKFRAGRFWCDVITNPQHVSVALKKISKADRIDAIGTGTYCDARK